MTDDGDVRRVRRCWAIERALDYAARVAPVAGAIPAADVIEIARVLEAYIADDAEQGGGR